MQTQNEPVTGERAFAGTLTKPALTSLLLGLTTSNGVPPLNLSIHLMLTHLSESTNVMLAIPKPAWSGCCITSRQYVLSQRFVLSWSVNHVCKIWQATHHLAFHAIVGRLAVSGKKPCFEAVASVALVDGGRSLTLESLSNFRGFGGSRRSAASQVETLILYMAPS